MADLELDPLSSHLRSDSPSSSSSTTGASSSSSVDSKLSSSAPTLSSHGSVSASDSEVEQPLSAATPSSLWAVALAVVNFDLEYGQKLERMVPDVKFSEDVTNTIAFSSFPDCTITERNTIFTFRVARNNEEPKKWLYGYVFYRQNRDASIHRGYLQKSIAILSENNLVDFYQRVIAVIGETFFDFGPKALDMAWRDILGWPQPQLSHHLQFPLLGKVIKFPMPTIRNGSFIFTPLPSVLDGSDGSSASSSAKKAKDKATKEQIKSSKSLFGSDSKISPSVVSLDDRFLHTVPVYAPLAPVISKIWLLWELMLLGQPILVLSPAPGLSSDAVLALTSLLSPLEYKGDFRPFFTIHDADFKNFSDDLWAPPSDSGLVVGGTNPYFFKALSHWYNIVTLSGKKRIQKYNPFLIANQGGQTEIADDNLNRGVGLIDYVDQVQCSGYQTVFPSGVDFKKYMKKPDKEHSAEACFNFNEKFLRYHMHLRTTTFLAPLRHYFDRLVANKMGQFKPFMKIPLVGDLNPAVLSSIQTHLAPGRNATELKFYERFASTTTFRRWYNKKKKIANDKIAADYIAYLHAWKTSKPFEGLGEMELVNMYQDGMDQQKKEADLLGYKGSVALRSALDELVKFLDPDLQAAIRMKAEAKMNHS